MLFLEVHVMEYAFPSFPTLISALIILVMYMYIVS